MYMYIPYTEVSIGTGSFMHPTRGPDHILAHASLSVPVRTCTHFYARIRVRLNHLLCHISHVTGHTCHMAYVTSHVTGLSHMSHVICHLSCHMLRVMPYGICHTCRMAWRGMADWHICMSYDAYCMTYGQVNDI